MAITGKPQNQKTLKTVLNGYNFNLVVTGKSVICPCLNDTARKCGIMKDLGYTILVCVEGTMYIRHNAVLLMQLNNILFINPRIIAFIHHESRQYEKYVQNTQWKYT